MWRCLDFAFVSKIAEYSGKQQAALLFFCPPTQRRPRISATNQRSLAVNFGKNSENSETLGTAYADARAVPGSRGQRNAMKHGVFRSRTLRRSSSCRIIWLSAEAYCPKAMLLPER